MNYDTLASKETIEKVIKNLAERGVEAFLVESGAEALEKIKEFIPAGASVMNGSSKTLEQIGYIDYLTSGDHGWNNLKEKILSEKDVEKQAIIRRQSVLSDYYLGSVHGLAENGEFIIASNSGTQLPHIVYTSPNLIFVVSTKKIVPTLQDAFERLEKYVYPLEDENIMKKYGIHTAISKVVIFKRENSKQGRKIRMILVNEDLGF